MSLKNSIAGKYDLGITLICGGGALLLGIAERVICGAPYNAIHMLGIESILPPVWLMSTLCLVWLFVAGGVIGAVMSDCASARSLRGCVFGVIALYSGLFYYPLLFSAILPFPSLLCILSVLSASVAAAIYLYRDDRMSSFVMWGSSAWSVYLTIITLMILGR